VRRVDDTPLLISPRRIAWLFPSISFVAAVLTAALSSSGCETPVGVKRLGRESVIHDIRADAVDSGVASQFSIQVLARNDLLDRYRGAPEDALRDLYRKVVQERARDELVALAELSFLTATKLESKKHYLAAVVTSYAYLFHPESRGALDPYDPRFRIAADVYNSALTEFLKSPSGDITIADGVHELPAGSLEIRASRPGFPWGPKEFGRFLPAYEFAVRGLRTRNRNPGLGAPLIAVRGPAGREEDEDLRTAADFLPSRAKIAATAFLRIDWKAGQSMPGRVSSSLELYAPFNTIEIDVDGLKVPLEADLTVPIAYTLQKSSIWRIELRALFSGESTEFKPGIFLTQPYSPGKIPVVFVHGTASSPARWAEMFNGLQSYRELREKYQFWGFIYNTGNPIIYSAHLLREALENVVRTLDPQGKDSALRRMVLIGHSQGGLLTKLQTVDSGNIFWNAVVSGGEEERDQGADQENLLRRVLIVRPLPFVARAVFISTPHRGSFMSRKWYAKFGSLFYKAPKKLLDVSRNIVVRDPTGIRKDLAKHIPTSVENMHPENPFMVALANLPIAPSVKVNSIVAVKGTGPVEGGNDGIVEYKSAHIEGAESECVIRWGHSCQDHPLTILEVRRILLEHLGQPAK